MDWKTEASLAVAILQLSEVSLLTQAIRTADISSGETFGPAGLLNDPAARFAPRDVYHPTPRIDPRVVYHPTPRFEPRRVLHPTEIVEPNRLLMSSEPTTHVKSESPLEPPWKVLPWPQTVHSTHKIKAVHLASDTKHIGSLIDFFL